MPSFSAMCFTHRSHDLVSGPRCDRKKSYWGKDDGPTGLAKRSLPSHTMAMCGEWPARYGREAEAQLLDLILADDRRAEAEAHEIGVMLERLARAEESEVTPAMAREVSPEKVAQAVVDDDAGRGHGWEVVPVRASVKRRKRGADAGLSNNNL